MSKCLPVVCLLALGLLPGCVFAVDSGSSYQDGNKLSKLEKRVAALEAKMNSCGEECCSGDDAHEHAAPKADEKSAKAEAEAKADKATTPKPATDGQS